MSEPKFKHCRACRAAGRTTTIFPSNARAWRSERCFGCHRSISDVDQRLNRAQREYDALLQLSQLLSAGRDFAQ